MRKLALLILVVLFAFSSSGFIAAQTTKETSASPTNQQLKVDMPDKSQVVQEVSTLGKDEMMGHIDWEKKIVYAVGDGVPPKDAINPAQARARAKRAAIDEAYARLIETINEVQVDATSTTRNFVNENRVVQTKVTGLVKNAEVDELKQASDGSFQVMMKMPMTGASGLSSAILPVQLANVRQVSIVAHVKQEPTDTDAPAKRPVEEPTPPVQRAPSNEKYTSLIVDTKGLGVKPALYPVVQTESGDIIYNVEVADPNATVEDGLCTYRKSLEEAKKMPKVGERPLIIKAVRVGGKYNVDIVVSNQDGKKITEANNLNPFLKWANVNVVID